MKTMRTIATLALLAAVATALPAARLKDISSIQGARHNQLLGYGLVVGLDGTGDSRQTVFTTQALSAMLNRFGALVSPQAIRVQNVAAVAVTVDLPPFRKPGDRVDVLVSSIGDARSLQGGLLLQTPLTGADGEVYVVAQGPISTGGFAAAGAGASVTKNHPTVGLIPDGALVERAVPTTIAPDDRLTINLNSPDFATASHLAAMVNADLGAAVAQVVDAASITVAVPPQYRGQAPELIARLGSLPILTDTVAKVVVNERTGTVVVGSTVSILPVAVAHAGLTVEIQTDVAVSQPKPFSQGQTVAVPQSTINVNEPQTSLKEVSGSTIQDLVRSLNAIKASPRDIIAILQAIKRSGALQAELEVI